MGEGGIMPDLRKFIKDYRPDAVRVEDIKKHSDFRVFIEERKKAARDDLGRPISKFFLRFFGNKKTWMKEGSDYMKAHPSVIFYGRVDPSNDRGVLFHEFDKDLWKEFFYYFDYDILVEVKGENWTV